MAQWWGGNAGDMVQSPVRELRPHTLWGNQAHAPQLLSHLLQILKPECSRARAPQPREVHTPKLECGPRWPQLEKSPCNKRPSTARNK